MVHDISVQIVLVLMLMGGLAAHLVDVNGAFLLGQFKPEEKIKIISHWDSKSFIHPVDCCF